MDISRTVLEAIVDSPVTSPEDRQRALDALAATSDGDSQGNLFTSFLTKSEIDKIESAFTDEAKDLYFGLLGGPADKRLLPVWCTRDHILRYGCVELSRGRVNPADINLSPGIVARIDEHLLEIDEALDERFQQAVEKIGTN